MTTGFPFELDLAVGAQRKRAALHIEGWVRVPPAEVLAEVVGLLERLGVETEVSARSPLTTGTDAPPEPVALPQVRRRRPPPVHKKFDPDDARRRAAEAV